jgi:hypothetical protein
MLLLGIGLEIVKANNILVIYDWIIYVCFGVAGVTFLGHVINYITVKKQVNKISKRF